MVSTVKVPVQSSDGATNTLFATDEDVLPGAAPIVLVKPALGVRASYYAPLFDALAPVGYRVVTADFRGHGRSSLRPSRRVDYGYRELLELDWPAEMEALGHRFPGAPVLLLGHSMGGQLAFLYAARHPGQVAGVIAIATCSVYWRAYKSGGSPGILALTQLARGLAALWGTFPGDRIGFAGREARTLMRDWARQARTGRYEPRGSRFDYEAALADTTVPGAIVTLTGDSYAPPPAARHLARKMPEGVVAHRHVEEPSIRNPHFRWVNEFDALLPEVEPILNRMFGQVR